MRDTSPPLNSLYINDRQPHYPLCASITTPEDDLQQQIRKFVTKNPFPDKAFYLRTYKWLPLSGWVYVATEGID